MQDDLKKMIKDLKTVKQTIKEAAENMSKSLVFKPENIIAIFKTLYEFKKRRK